MTGTRQVHTAIRQARAGQPVKRRAQPLKVTHMTKQKTRRGSKGRGKGESNQTNTTGRDETSQGKKGDPYQCIHSPKEKIGRIEAQLKEEREKREWLEKVMIREGITVWEKKNTVKLSEHAYARKGIQKSHPQPNQKQEGQADMKHNREESKSPPKHGKAISRPLSS